MNSNNFNTPPPYYQSYSHINNESMGLNTNGTGPGNANNGGRPMNNSSNLPGNATGMFSRGMDVENAEVGGVRAANFSMGQGSGNIDLLLQRPMEFVATSNLDPTRGINIRPMADISTAVLTADISALMDSLEKMEKNQVFDMILNKTGNEAWTVLQCARICGVIDDINALILSDGGTLLHSFASRGDDVMVNLLLNNGAEINAERTTDKVRPFYLAVQRGYTAVVKIFLEHAKKLNVDLGINAIFNNNETLVQLAAFRGYDEILRMLLEYGANSMIVRSDGKNAFQLALEGRHKNAIRILLEHSVKQFVAGGNNNLNNQSNRLSNSSGVSTGSTMEVVLSEEKNVEQVNVNGASAASLSKGGQPANREFRHQRSVETVVTELDKVIVALKKSTCKNRAGVLEDALVDGVIDDLNAPILSDGGTLLHLAAEMGDVQLVNFLLETGVEPNRMRSDDGMTPYALALMNGHTEVAKILLVQVKKAKLL